MLDTTVPTIPYTGERIIREPERQAITGMSRPQWYRLERDGRAPGRVRVTERTVGWRLSDLTAWVEARLSGREWHSGSVEAA